MYAIRSYYVAIKVNANLVGVWTSSKILTDFNAYYKSKVLIITSITLLVLLIIGKITGEMMFKNKDIINNFIVLFALTLILSTVLSCYKNISINGAPNRNEGLSYNFV